MNPNSNLHKLFHTLWTKAVNTPDYDKEEWIKLETILNKMSKTIDNLHESLSDYRWERSQ